jgi:hypothetical protein
MERVIDELYRVFQPYRLGPDFSGCSCCVSPADCERLANTELRDLTLADLDSYAFKAMTTWGETRHFKHFLPRLLEIAYTDFDEFLSAETLFGKLTYGEWDEWPEQERRAVNGFLREFWRSVIASEVARPGDDSIDTAICAIGNACTTIMPFLQQWTASDGPAPPRQLAQFVLLNIDDIARRQRLMNPHWDERSAQAGEVFEWLRLPATYEYLCNNQDALDGRLAQAVPALAALGGHA